MLGLSELAANLMLDALGQAAADGTLSLYQGSRGAPTSKLLAELRLGDPAFARAEGGRILAQPVGRSEPARADGKPDWCAIRDADGQALLYGTMGEDCFLDGDGSVKLGASVFIDDVQRPMEISLPVED